MHERKESQGIYQNICLIRNCKGISASLREMTPEGVIERKGRTWWIEIR